MDSGVYGISHSRTLSVDTHTMSGKWHNLRTDAPTNPKSLANAAEPAAVYCGVPIPLALSGTYSGTYFVSDIKKDLGC